MEADLIKEFSAELGSLADSRSLSKNKIQDITKAAMKAKAHYKHVVFLIEKLLNKSKPEQRLFILYVIDSIIRASKHQLKEKDVFGPRFLKHFDKMLEILLKCNSRDRLKLVRTLNLWMSNRVFPESVVQPFRDRCKEAGIMIGFEEVERAVKGKTANMSLYNGQYRRRRHSGGRRAQGTPPLDDGLLGAGPSAHHPPIPTFVLSEELVDGTISERELLEMAQTHGIDRLGALSKDKPLLQRALHIFVASLKTRIAEIQAEKAKPAGGGTSLQNVLTKDFEYSDDEEEREKEPEPEEPKPMSHNEVLEVAQSLFTAPGVLQKINELLAPAPAQFQANLMADNHMIPTSMAGFPPPPNLLGLPLPGIPNLTAQMLNVQSAQSLLSLQQRAAQLQALGATAGPQRNLLMLGNPHALLNPFGLPMPDLQAQVQAQQAQQQQQQQQQQQMILNEMEAAAMEKKPDEVPKERSKESRERRRMGLPPIRPGFTIIASRTLWLRKISENVTESELRKCVDSCGDVQRVKIIGKSACAFITMETRKAANDVIQKLREVVVARKQVKVYWARGPGANSDAYVDYWEPNRGIFEIPYDKLPVDLEKMCEGSILDMESLPADLKSIVKENGVRCAPTGVAPPSAAVAASAAAPPPPGLGFPFGIPPGAQFPKPPPPGGVPPPLLNLSVPPPPGMAGAAFAPAPPPPGLGAPGAPTGVPPPGFDPNKPPPMFQAFNPTAPPPPFGAFGARGAPPPLPLPQAVPPPSAGAPFRGPPPPTFRADSGPPTTRGRERLPDQAEMWSREQQRSGHTDRRRGAGGNEEGGRSGGRRSRWGDDDRRISGGAEQRVFRRRSPERRRRSPSNERRDHPEIKRIAPDDETVSSTTTVDEVKPCENLPPTDIQQQQAPPLLQAPPLQTVPKPEEGDQTDEVPMDLE